MSILLGWSFSTLLTLNHSNYVAALSRMSKRSYMKISHMFVNGVLTRAYETFYRTNINADIQDIGKIGNVYTVPFILFGNGI